MDVFEAIARRHSYRGTYVDKTVPREDLRRIVQAGMAAPSADNTQTTSFVIVDDPDPLRQIGALSSPPANRALAHAKAIIACLVDVEPEPISGHHALMVDDCAAAVENMLLAITALGYASVWVDGWLRAERRAEQIGELLGVPAGKRVRVLLPIGVPAEKHTPPPKKPFDARAWFNRYGG